LTDVFRFTVQGLKKMKIERLKDIDAGPIKKDHLIGEIISWKIFTFV
jgi:hypothetical protein